MVKKKAGRLATTAAAAMIAIAGGGAIAYAAESPATPSPTSTPSDSPSDHGPTRGSSDSGSSDNRSGDGRDGQCGGSGPEARDGQGRMGHPFTEVTGDELTRVTEAVESEESGVTVGAVRKAQDGSYHVLGTRDGQPVMVEVSSDLATVEVHTGGPGGMRGPRGMGPGTRDERSGGSDHGRAGDATRDEMTAPSGTPSLPDGSSTLNT